MAVTTTVIDRLKTFNELMDTKDEIKWSNIDKLFTAAKLTVLSPAKIYAVIEPYMGSPSKETPKYERVRYRYGIESQEQAKAYQHNVNVRIHAQGYARTRANFGRDKEFDSADLLHEIFNSDLKVKWASHVTRCVATGQWLLAKEPLTEEQRAKAVSYNWLDTQIQPFERAAERATFMEKAEKERSFIEQHTSRLNIDFETLLQYVVDNGEVARNYLKNIKPVDIPRFTLELTPKDVEWPKWYVTSPIGFRTLAEACKATPEVLLAGTFDQNLFKAYRTTFNEANPENQIPNSPKVHGLLEYFKASEEVLKGFEQRTMAKGFATTAKAADIAKKQNRFFISNDTLPLFMIGNWGKEPGGVRTYQSCQTWYRGGWAGGGGNNYCRTPASWEDPYILVAWVGEEQVMRTRVLLHIMKDSKTKKTLLGINNWYGTNTNQPQLIKLLAEWAKDQGYELVKLFAGGYNNENRCEWPEQVSFNHGQWYSDLGGFTNHGQGGQYGKVKTNLQLAYSKDFSSTQRYY